jgi:hypothetical protein
MNRNEWREYGKALADQWKTSGISQEAFASANNISAHRLRYWLYKRKSLTKEVTAGSFIRIGTYESTHDIIISYPSGVELRLSSGVPVMVIKELIKMQG